MQRNAPRNEMKLTKQHTTEAVLAEIIHRLVQRRIELGLTQQDVADQTGIAIRTLKQIEAGGNCQFSTMIRLLQAYDLVDRLDILVPEASISPIQFIEQQQTFKATTKMRVLKKGNTNKGCAYKLLLLFI